MQQMMAFRVAAILVLVGLASLVVKPAGLEPTQVGAFVGALFAAAGTLLGVALERWHTKQDQDAKDESTATTIKGFITIDLTLTALGLLREKRNLVRAKGPNPPQYDPQSYRAYIPPYREIGPQLWLVDRQSIWHLVTVEHNLMELNRMLADFAGRPMPHDDVVALDKFVSLCMKLVADAYEHFAPDMQFQTMHQETFQSMVAELRATMKL